MVWSAETSQGYESAKIAGVAVPYLQGRALDIGCGMRKVWPSVIGVDNGETFGTNTDGIRCDVTSLEMFADESCDAVFSSHVIEDFERDKVPAILTEWTRVLKFGGYLCLYVPSANLYPKVGEEGANVAHKWDIYPGDIEAMLKAMTTDAGDDAPWPQDAPVCGWELIESEERGDADEYSLWIVARKVASGWSENLWQRRPGGKPRALVVRYGAIGDQIMASSILPELKRSGFHVVYNCTPAGQDIIRHDPHIDEWIIQAKDFVPNEQLGPYWSQLERRCDLFINLCESVEGSLLALPGRREDQMHTIIRRNLLGSVNYLERTHDLAGMRHNFNPRFYATESELAAAREKRAAMDGPVIYWAINGSSPHKVYAYPQAVIALLLDKTDAHVVLTGDKEYSVPIQEAIRERLIKDGYDLARLHAWCGVMSVRESLTFAQVADIVIGPETGVLNSVCMEDVWKVIYLSHSSVDNLTRHWRKTIVMQPDPIIAPCYPCHRLHYDWSRCAQDESTKAALCAAGIAPRTVFDVFTKLLAKVREPAAIEMVAAE